MSKFNIVLIYTDDVIALTEYFNKTKENIKENIINETWNYKNNFQDNFESNYFKKNTIDFTLMWELEADTVKDLLEIQKKLLSSITAKRCNFRLNISTNLSYPINGYSYSPNRFAFTSTDLGSVTLSDGFTLSNGFTFTKNNTNSDVKTNPSNNVNSSNGFTFTNTNSDVNTNLSNNVNSSNGLTSTNTNTNTNINSNADINIGIGRSSQTQSQNQSLSSKDIVNRSTSQYCEVIKKSNDVDIPFEGKNNERKRKYEDNLKDNTEPASKKHKTT